MRTQLKIRGALNLSLQGDTPSQEDYVLPSGERGIFALADGFGGPGPGAAAARGACEAVKAFLEKEAGDHEATMPFVLRSYYSLAANVLFNALVHANRKLLALNRDRRGSERGGASVVAGYLDGEFLALANVGACAAWIFRSGVGAELVSPRTYSRLRDPMAFDTRADQTAPLTALGLAEDLEPEISEFRIQPGDWLLLHSDGLSSAARDSIRDLQLGTWEPGQALEEAQKLICNFQNSDNTSISLIIF